jgi:hypothetical protein
VISRDAAAGPPFAWIRGDGVAGGDDDADDDRDGDGGADADGGGSVVFASAVVVGARVDVVGEEMVSAEFPPLFDAVHATVVSRHSTIAVAIRRVRMIPPQVPGISRAGYRQTVDAELWLPKTSGSGTAPEAQPIDQFTSTSR